MRTENMKQWSIFSLALALGSVAPAFAQGSDSGTTEGWRSNGVEYQEYDGSAKPSCYLSSCSDCVISRRLRVVSRMPQGDPWTDLEVISLGNMQSFRSRLYVLSQASGQPYPYNPEGTCTERPISENF